MLDFILEFSYVFLFVCKEVLCLCEFSFYSIIFVYCSYVYNIGFGFKGGCIIYLFMVGRVGDKVNFSLNVSFV